MNNTDFFINGHWEKGKGAPFFSENPATEEILWSGNAVNAVQIQEAVEASKKAFLQWRKYPLEKRYAYIKKFQELLIKKKEYLAEVIAKETGKPLWEALLEVSSIESKVGASYKAYTLRAQNSSLELPNSLLETHHLPHGVSSVYGPFNFPAHLPNAHIIPALLSGNTVIFKPSELTPLVGSIITELWQESGLPQDVFCMVQGGKETGVALAQNPHLNALFFTGSFTTGQFLLKESLAYPQRIVALELGGNNPIIVGTLDDIASAVYTIIQSSFLTTGQRCTAARRLIIVEDATTEPLIKKLIEVSERLVIDAYDAKITPFMGPLISKNARDRVCASFQHLEKLGGKILLQPEIRDPGAFVSCGIIDMTNASKFDEEIFGPIVQVYRKKDLYEAIKEANNTIYGLSASLLSTKETEFQEVFDTLNSGIINWNRPTTQGSGHAPFGGIKASGNFRPSGLYAVDYTVYPVAVQKATKDSIKDLLPGITL